MSTYNFTVDAALLRELGERLVGRPYMALAELIKNSYDADATDVEINFSEGEIVVSDNGHGMSELDFAERWMRIGTTRKTITRLSPRLKRALTGSKGVGRLAVQILGNTTVVSSVALKDPRYLKTGTVEGIEAQIDWSAAVRQGELTKVKVEVAPPTGVLSFPKNKNHGTIVRVGGLVDSWNSDQFVELAREIWALRPPFEDASGSGMSISLTSDDQDVEQSFATQMNAILDIWTAKISGRLLPIGKQPPKIDGILPARLPSDADEDESGEPIGNSGASERFLKVVVELRDSVAKRVVYYRVPSCAIDEVRFDIRVFNLQNRQPLGIGVNDARAYLRKFGGVSIFDGGFRLPYYGVDQDWLNSERDHARRLDRSKLVPSALHVKKGLQDLPANSRLYGAVHVSTGREAKSAGTAKRRDPLSIQVSRDRLTDNAAYQQLRVLVRAGIDLYAMEMARAKLLDVTKRTEGKRSPSDTLGALANLVSRSRDEIPDDLYKDITSAVGDARQSAREAELSSMAYASLLGALATAGSTSLAYEHEVSKQVAALGDLADDLTSIADDLPSPQDQVVRKAVGRMQQWQERVAGIRAVFGPLLSKESRDSVDRFRARSTVRKVVREIQPLANNIEVDTTGVPEDVMLRSATLPAWTSILQNLLLNAYNAVSSVPDPIIKVTAEKRARRNYLTILDNGAGVDLEDAEQLWQPFERRLLLSPEKEAAGLGGMGLGLTIVRMIGDEIGVHARFVKPPRGFETAVQLDWERE